MNLCPKDYINVSHPFEPLENVMREKLTPVIIGGHKTKTELIYSKGTIQGNDAENVRYICKGLYGRLQNTMLNVRILHPNALSCKRWSGFRLNYLTIDNALCIYRDLFVVL